VKGADGKALPKESAVAIVGVRVARLVVFGHPQMMSFLIAREVASLPKSSQTAAALLSAQWVQWFHDNRPTDGVKSFDPFINETVERITRENGGAL
jgi:hypothetical protein